jgi:hypothetical protein
VFADPSGRRLRLLRVAGIAASAALAVCLGAVGVALSGGPRAPFTQWAAPHPVGGARHGAQQGSASPAGQRTPAARGTTAATIGAGQTAIAPSTGGRVPAASASSPSAGAVAVPSASASASPVPVNRSGRTPPGHTQTKSPNPHSSASGA